MQSWSATLYSLVSNNVIDQLQLSWLARDHVYVKDPEELDLDFVNSNSLQHVQSPLFVNPFLASAEVFLLKVTISFYFTSTFVK